MEIKESAPSHINYIDYLDSLSKKQLMVMLARARQEETQSIAIVGMGCRFPGDIDSPQAFWELLRSAQTVRTANVGAPLDSLGQPRWNLDAPDLAPIADLLRSGAYLSDVDRFDAEYFGISAEEARYMDPQQRLLLEVAVQALADANLTRATLQKRRIGIFVGSGFMEYMAAGLRNGMRPEHLSQYTLQGTMLSAMAGRLGLMLGVNGPAISLDTASSSALAATHLAMQSLRRRECDIAIVGSCHLLLSPMATAAIAKLGVLSPTGQSRPFTNDADGHVRGEGCGVFVLQRHQDCVADGTSAYAMLKGSAVYQHGDRLALSVASGLGQHAVIQLALQNAGITPSEVQYVEAQANGSRLGGVAEVETIALAYGRTTSSPTSDAPNAPALYIGSCKANIGYLEVASGAAALMKTALMLAHGEIAPQPGVHNLDPSVPWRKLGLRFATEALPWPNATHSPRRLAGISGLGMNGINAHAILESMPDRRTADQSTHIPSSAPALLVLSAHNALALQKTAERLHHHLLTLTDWDYHAVCHTLAQGRNPLKIRRSKVIRNNAELLACLAQFSDHLSQQLQQTQQIQKESSRPQTGIFLKLTDINAASSVRTSIPTNAQASSNQFVSLTALVKNRIDKMGMGASDAMPSPAAELAHALAYIDLIRALKIDITACAVDTSTAFSDALLDVITGHRDADDVCMQWKNGNVSAHHTSNTSTHYTGWESVNDSINGTDLIKTIRRPIAAKNSASITAATLTTHGWLNLVAEQFDLGAQLDLSILQPHTPMMRLPAPVLTGQHHWEELFKWS